IVTFHRFPERAQSRQALFGRIAGDDGAVQRTDRGADHPIRLHARFVHSLVDAELVGAERPAALQHQHYLSWHGFLHIRTDKPTVNARSGVRWFKPTMKAVS